MDHIYALYIIKFQHATDGVKNVLYNVNQTTCKIYCQAKFTWKKFTKDCELATRVDYIQNRYIFCLLDDYSRFLQIGLLKIKMEVASQLDSACHDIRAKYSGVGQFNILLYDIDIEYTSAATQIVLWKYEIKFKPAESYVLEHNGIAEHLNWTL